MNSLEVTSVLKDSPHNFFLRITIMILAGLKVIYVGTLWVSFLLIIVGFVMATIGFFGKDSK